MEFPQTPTWDPESLTNSPTLHPLSYHGINKHYGKFQQIGTTIEFPVTMSARHHNLLETAVFLNMRRKRMRNEVRSKMSWIGYNYGQRRSFLSSPTNLLIVLNVIVFVVMLLSGDVGDCNSLVCELMAQTGQAVYQGAYWQLFTSMFVHFGFLHIIFNMFGLYYLGRINETRFGTASYLTIYLVSGLLGNVMSMFLLPSDTLSGGASGAIFGLVGSYVAIAREARQLGAALMYAAFVFIMSMGLGVNVYAHFFGLISGLILGLLYSRQRTGGGYSTGYSFTT